MAKRWYGNVPQGIDPRDKWFEFSPVMAASLPRRYVRSEMARVPNLDQGSLGSCGLNTAAECIVENQLQQGLAVAVPDRLFMYYNTRWLMGTVTQDSGVDNRSMMKALATWGWPTEKSYDVRDFKKKPSQAAYADAAKNKITGYGAVIQALNQMKAAIWTGDEQGGDCFIFGFDVFPQIESDEAAETGVLTTPSVTQNAIGGHDVSLFGWDDDLTIAGTTGFFWFRNHWKNSPTDWWGSREMPGCGLIPYAYATNGRWCRDFWIINRVPGGVVPPPAPPEPSPPPPPPTPPPSSRRTVTVTGTGIEVKVDGVPVG